MNNCLFCDQSAGRCVFCGVLCDVCGTPLDPGTPPICPRCVALTDYVSTGHGGVA